MATMQVQAQVPWGMQPGQTFTLQTPSGQVPVQVPPGAAPGQQVIFTVPAHPATVVGNPVIAGNASYAQSGPPAQHGMLEAGYGGSKPYRVDPLSATADGVPLLQGIPLEKQEKKVSEIRRGGELAQDNLPFPEQRQFRDAVWGLVFAVVAVAMTAGAVYFGRTLYDDVDVTSEEGATIANGAYAALAGAVASLFATMAYMWLASSAPACVVWTSLLFSPVLLIVGGVAILTLGGGMAIMGLIFILIGALSLSCVFFCYRPLIPFMIKIVQAVSTVIRRNPCVVAVSVMGSFASVAWVAICVITFAGAFQRWQGEVQNANTAVQYIILFFAVLIFVVGGQVAYNTCHVTYCGVFGRWYYGKDQEGGLLRKSLGVALTTSFGSICCGAFLIAAIRALEYVIRSARQDAAESGNAFCCVLLCMLEWIVGCIGDVLEYFSEWAFVQVAVRGTSFVESARITYSMLTCANVLYVLQDLLINAVVNLGALLCGIVGGAVGFGVGAALQGGYTAGAAGGIAGFLAGLLAGGTAAGILSSGTKTILALWAENPAPLQASHPEIHQEFERRIYGKLYQ